MTMHPRDLRLLFHFAEIARAGSVRGAARALGLSAPVVSASLRDLEEITGTTLIRRTTRRLALTDAGREMVAHARSMCAAAERAMQTGQDAQAPSGPLRVTTAIELSVTWLPAILSDFRARYPEVQISVTADDAPVDLIGSEIDVALRVTLLRDRKDVGPANARSLTLLPINLVCRPDLGPLRGDLAERVAATGYISSFPVEREMLFAERPDGREIAVEVPVALRASDRLTTHALARQGLGAALLLHETVAADLAAGHLIHVDPDLDFGVVGVRPICADPQPPKQVRCFVAFLEERFRAGA
ncbi:MAG: LysR family transcriptional regulator [Pseudomonadota bacterium]